MRADGTGDVTRTHIAWTLRRGAPLTPSPLLVGDELYVVSDGGIASCLDARTGAVHWQQRLGGSYSASPVFADGRIYFSTRRGGRRSIAPATTIPQAGDQQARRRDAGLDGRRRRLVLHPHRDAPVSDRRKLKAKPIACTYIEFTSIKNSMVRYNITYPTTLVLHAIAGGARYGFDIADRTGLQTGTVYPALRRLDALGFVRSSWEAEKVARREQRPARRYYEITKAAAMLDVAMKRFENLGRLGPRPRHA